MKKKLVIWGSNAQDEKVLIAIQLFPDENNTKIYVLSEAMASPEVYRNLMDKWRLDQEFAFPEGVIEISRPLSISEGLLPDELKVEKGDLLSRAQAEWHFIVLSAKLHEAYKSELEDLKEKVNHLTEYDGALWENLKSFWSKVQSQVKEKNLFWDHANTLRNETNELFSKLKELRAVVDEEFRNESRVFKDEFFSLIGDVESKLRENANLNRLFEDLKNIQQKYRDTQFTKEDRNKVWAKMDAAFKAVKEKKYGPDNAPGNSPHERLKRRLDGLLRALDKMQRSVKRDDEEIAFQSRRADRTEGQLELQIRQAKMKMLQERVKSKKEKLADMLKTKEELENKIAKFAKKAASSKKKEKPKVKPESDEKITDALGATLGVALGDVMDTMKAVAEVIGDKVSDVVTEIKEEIQEEMKERQEEKKEEEE